VNNAVAMGKGQSLGNGNSNFVNLREREQPRAQAVG
jgi:hypothetical protein